MTHYQGIRGCLAQLLLYNAATTRQLNLPAQVNNITHEQYKANLADATITASPYFTC